jgi:putative DNA primase/helicase
MLTAAIALHAAGCSVVSVRADGSKHPRGAWKHYQTKRATEDQLRTWFESGHPGIGIVTGAVSDNLEMLELEGRAVDEGVLNQLTEILVASGLGELWQRIATGWLERSPSGGLHFHYRVNGTAVPGNTKLASRLAREDEYTEDERELKQRHPHKKILRGLIETRGEGGFVVTAPSHGQVHATGKPYELLAGGPATTPVITADEHQALHTICRMLDTVPTDEAPSDHTGGTAKVMPEPLDEAAAFLFSTDRDMAPGGVTPGDDFEQRATWADILQPHGWKLLFTSGQTHYWRRPGKDGREPSATTGRAMDRDRLYVFTTSTEFTPEVPYTKFGAYTLLNHGGDHSAAAKELRRLGYGHPAPEPIRHLTAVPNPPPATDGTAALNIVQHPAAETPGTYTRTDDGNALRLVDEHEQQIRYCPQRSWLVWDGYRWTWDEKGSIYELARDIARALPDGEGESQHRLRSLSARGLDAMIKVARTDPRIVAPLATLDANPWQLNTPDGVVDLRTGTMTAPDPASLHTRTTTVGPDFEKTAERWLRFIGDTFGKDPELIVYVQRLLGISLIGTVLEQILPFAFGDGANGKSTLADTVMRVIGIGETGYSISAPSEMLLASSANNHPTEIARLAGARMVVASELDDGQKFAEARIKMLTGRDIITGRFMRQDFFSFTPTHTLWLLGNHKPAVRTGGPAFWRRLRLVPFLHTVPEHLRDTHLEEHLVDHEASAILAWLIRGGADYHQHGITTPSAVQAATEEYQGDQDTVARFIADMCTLGTPGAQTMQTPSSVLRAAYERWCQQEGEEGVSAKKFAATIQKPPHNVQSSRNMRFRFFDGIRLNQTETEGDPEGGW